MMTLPFLMALMGAGIGLLIVILIFSTISDSIDCESLSNEEVVKECESALSTSWLVISILPIVLFFSIFSIFGGLGGGASLRVISISNIEERAKKMEKMGVAHILKKTKAKILDRSKRGNELYEINMIPNYPLKYLKYEDPSTANKIYGCFVPSEFETADEAMGWKWKLTEEEYQQDLIYEA